ncbi:rRNA maturation RNase YbeY [Geovibrio thiophilus]|uniref:Endoribonuclease YbeY n=2 Tax=Geovibrio thiophilus TaxID=139438 RepID=A0A3R5V0W4_9BACT|nr:rRNA maturation RNase YbeY [Geovibrio thiophilus]
MSGGFTEEFLTKISMEVFAFAEAAFEEAEISVLITDDAEIRTLNSQYRQKDYATDVLSFPMAEYPLNDGGMLGDIVISLDTAKKQAEENEIPLVREFSFLYIHGLLHLLGFDHETSEEDEKEMFDMQEEILRKLIKNGLVL